MTDLQEELDKLLISVNQDLDKYFQTDVEYDRGYREGSVEILTQLVDIIERYR